MDETLPQVANHLDLDYVIDFYLCSEKHVVFFAFMYAECKILERFIKISLENRSLFSSWWY